VAYLNNGKPFALLHQPYQLRGELLDVGSKLAGSAERVGFIAAYDCVHEQGVVADLGDVVSDLRLADAGYRFGRIKIGGRIDAAPWIQRPEPNSTNAWDATINDAAAAQRELGLDAITTPGPELLGAQAISDLRASLDAARRGYASRPTNDPPWFVRVTVHDEWLVTPASRGALLNEISNLPEDVGVALRVRWRKNDPEMDADLLQGLKSFALTLANDDRALLLLNSGIVGWLSLAWNVNALSAGLSLRSWADSWQRGGGAKRGQPKPPDIKWFFEPMLLKRFTEEEHDDLVAQGAYEPCTCFYCSSLVAGAPWKATAYQHALYALAVLTNEVASAPATQRRQKVIDVVKRAESNWDRLIPPALTASLKPAHLTTWLQVL
jgi:hypothetical protein